MKYASIIFLPLRSTGKKDKNIIGNKLIFGRFGLPCQPAGRRLRSSVPISKENKATGAMTDIHKMIIPIDIVNLDLRA